jgi:hypothetical protein
MLMNSSSKERFKYEEKTAETHLPFITWCHHAPMMKVTLLMVVITYHKPSTLCNKMITDRNIGGYFLYKRQNATKLDRDERTHHKTLEGMRRHETEAKIERPPEEAA